MGTQFQSFSMASIFVNLVNIKHPLMHKFNAYCSNNTIYYLTFRLERLFCSCEQSQQWNLSKQEFNGHWWNHSRNHMPKCWFIRSLNYALLYWYCFKDLYFVFSFYCLYACLFVTAFARLSIHQLVYRFIII